jgi:RsiW-degrading membrane proteinase PrsW (M82 family)
MIIYAALGIAFLIPVGFLALLLNFNLFKKGDFTVNFVTIVGGGVAYGLAAQINPAMINAGWVTRSQVIQITAPILEEVLKSLILVYLIQRAEFNYVVDGAIYGFGAGIGFAIIENFEYITNNPEIALPLALARVFSTNLIHATASGVIGTALAYRRGDATWRGWFFVGIGYLFSMGFHMGFNTMVNGGAFLIFAIAFGFVGVGLILYVIRQGLNTQKMWVSETLGDQDRVTKSEVQIVQNIESIKKKILEPVKKQFGADKVPVVEKIIYNQAEMGIKRKLLESTPNESKRKEIEAIVQKLAKEMVVLQKEAGFYCMMFVRRVYLEQNTKVFDSLTARIAESSTGQKGGGLFDRASERMKQSPSKKEDKS